MAKKKPSQVQHVPAFTNEQRKALMTILEEDAAIDALYELLEHGHTNEIPNEYAADFRQLGFKVHSYTDAEI